MTTSDRVHLARENLDLISVVVGKAVAGGAHLDEVVVLLLDTRDDIGRELARAMNDRGDGLDLDAEEARVLGRGEIPTAISVLPLGLAELLFADTHPAVSSGLQGEPPMGRLRVVVVAAGGVTLTQLPVVPVQTKGRM